MWRFIFLIVVLFTLPSFWAQAEYRVFILQITTIPTQPGEQPQVRTVQSTLDPDQYRGYYPVGKNEYVTYTNTWRCWGRTDHMPMCRDPKELAAEQSTEQAATAKSPERTPASQ